MTAASIKSVRLIDCPTEVEERNRYNDHKPVTWEVHLGSASSLACSEVMLSTSRDPTEGHSWHTMIVSSTLCAGRSKLVSVYQSVRA